MPIHNLSANTPESGTTRLFLSGMETIYVLSDSWQEPFPLTAPQNSAICRRNNILKFLAHIGSHVNENEKKIIIKNTYCFIKQRPVVWPIWSNK